MDVLFDYQDNLLVQVKDTFYRYLIDEINWDQRMLAIKGPRGAGKTTLLLQYIKYRLKKPREEVLYVTADHHWFYTHTLVETAADFYKYGGRYLFIDEVHKYPRWSRELKNLYDGYPDMRVVFSASSALDIYRGESDLSRRVITYTLPGLSFREFLQFNGDGTFPAFSLEEIILDHGDISHSVRQQLPHPLPLFKKYLRYGYLPLFRGVKPEEVSMWLSQIISTVIETDLAVIKDYTAGTSFKVKKLLGVLAESAPFKPNIAALARKLDASRESVYAWIISLYNARLLNVLLAEGKGVSLLQKPDKIYLENTNLAYILKSQPDTGTLRETFLFNQFINAKHKVTLPRSGDFLIGDRLFEVGGKNKTRQAAIASNTIIASDDIEVGFQYKIPLWLFGFLY